VSENVEILIRDHRDPSKTRRWESSGFYAWDTVTVLVGRLRDGRWYVERLTHPRTGPYRAELYATEEEALAVAAAVMAATLPLLDGDRAFTEVPVVG
jgi:hypothetical protein